MGDRLAMLLHFCLGLSGQLGTTSDNRGRSAASRAPCARWALLAAAMNGSCSRAAGGQLERRMHATAFPHVLPCMLLGRTACLACWCPHSAFPRPHLSASLLLPSRLRCGVPGRTTWLAPWTACGLSCSTPTAGALPRQPMGSRCAGDRLRGWRLSCACIFGQLIASGCLAW